MKHCKLAEQEGEGCISKVDAIPENKFNIKAAEVYSVINAHRVGQSVKGRLTQMIARFHSRTMPALACPELHKNWLKRRAVLLTILRPKT